jgi:hypothetical protein
VGGDCSDDERHYAGQKVQGAALIGDVAVLIVCMVVAQPVVTVVSGVMLVVLMMRKGCCSRARLCHRRARYDARKLGKYEHRHEPGSQCPQFAQWCHSGTRRMLIP